MVKCVAPLEMPFFLHNGKCWKAPEILILKRQVQDKDAAFAI
jgi:hypothetical protein